MAFSTDSSLHSWGTDGGSVSPVPLSHTAAIAPSSRIRPGMAMNQWKQRYSPSSSYSSSLNSPSSAFFSSFPSKHTVQRKHRQRRTAEPPVGVLIIANRPATASPTQRIRERYNQQKALDNRTRNTSTRRPVSSSIHPGSSRGARPQSSCSQGGGRKGAVPLYSNGHLEYYFSQQRRRQREEAAEEKSSPSAVEQGDGIVNNKPDLTQAGGNQPAEKEEGVLIPISAPPLVKIQTKIGELQKPEANCASSSSLLGSGSSLDRPATVGTSMRRVKLAGEGRTRGRGRDPYFLPRRQIGTGEEQEVLRQSQGQRRYYLGLDQPARGRQISTFTDTGLYSHNSSIQQRWTGKVLFERQSPSDPWIPVYRLPHRSR